MKFSELQIGFKLKLPDDGGYLLLTTGPILSEELDSWFVNGISPQGDESSYYARSDDVVEVLE